MQDPKIFLWKTLLTGILSIIPCYALSQPATQLYSRVANTECTAICLGGTFYEKRDTNTDNTFYVNNIHSSSAPSSCSYSSPISIGRGESIACAVETWNRLLADEYDLAVVYNSTEDIATDAANGVIPNGKNNITERDEQWFDMFGNQDLYAFTYTVSSCNCSLGYAPITEADIIFQYSLFPPDLVWELGNLPPSNPLPPPNSVEIKIPYQSALLHEIGHAFGLGHIKGMDTMTQADDGRSLQPLLGGWPRSSFSPSIGHFVLGPGTTQFVELEHSKSGSTLPSDLEVIPFDHDDDIGVTSWVPAYNFDEYCPDPTPGGVGSQGDILISEYTIVNRSEFTYTSSLGLQNGYYLSSDQNIDASDILLTYSKPILAPYSYQQRIRGKRLSMPITHGIYYVGHFIDRTNLVTEIYEGNNSVAMPGQIRITCP